MDKTITIALVVLICSIVVFFSKELGDLVKKTFALPGMKLLLPIVIATALIVNYEPWVYFVLTKFQDFLLALTEKLTHWMPFRKGASDVIKVLLLMMLSFVPVIAMNYWIKKKDSFNSHPYPGQTVTFLWLIFAILLTIDYRY